MNRIYIDKKPGARLSGRDAWIRIDDDLHILGNYMAVVFDTNSHGILIKNKEITLTPYWINFSSLEQNWIDNNYRQGTIL